MTDVGTSNGVDETCGWRAKNARQLTARSRIIRGGLLAFLLGVFNGCYSYIPVRTQPVSGQTVSFRLNDQGRAALSESIGSAADRIEGTIELQNDSGYVLQVQSVAYFSGQKSNWAGERVPVAKRYVVDPQQREFSRGKTTLAVLFAAGVILAVLSTANLLGSGTPGTDQGSTGTGEGQ